MSFLKLGYVKNVVMMKIKIATWNVNSIRSRIENILDWISVSKPDVILIQELKCTDDQFPYSAFESLDYNIEVLGQKAYNGVAIFSKYRLENIMKFLPLYDVEKKADNDARYIEVLMTINKTVFTLANVYVPNGTEGKPEPGQKLDETEKFYHKLRFYERVRERFKVALENDERLLMGGDYNTCPELIDMYSIKKDGDICCNYKEREKLREVFNLGVCDVLRKYHKEHDIFTWWRYRPPGAWEKNEGLRLDLFLATPNMMDYMVSCDVESHETRGKPHPSDHAPLVCEVEF